MHIWESKPCFLRNWNGFSPSTQASEDDGHERNYPPQHIQCFACPCCFLLFSIRDECLQHMSREKHFSPVFKLSGMFLLLIFSSLLPFLHDVAFRGGMLIWVSVSKIFSIFEIWTHLLLQVRKSFILPAIQAYVLCSLLCVCGGGNVVEYLFIFFMYLTSLFIILGPFWSSCIPLHQRFGKSWGTFTFFWVNMYAAPFWVV